MPIELRSPGKGLINIKNKGQKCFLWCHVRHINPSKDHPGRIKKVDKRLASNLNYDGIEFLVKEKDFKKKEVQNNICINVFDYGNELVFPIHVSDKKFKDSMDLLLLVKDDKSHYVYIKIFLVVLLIKFFVLMINLVNRFLFIEMKMLLMNLLKQFLKNISTVKT